MGVAGDAGVGSGRVTTGVGRRSGVVVAAVVVAVTGAALLASCGELPCAARPTQSSRDLCHFERARSRGAGELQAVAADVAAIVDPIVRSAAVMTWVRTHRGEYDPGLAASLCALLTGQEAESCRRQVGSPHLQDPQFR